MASRALAKVIFPAIAEDVQHHLDKELIVSVSWWVNACACLEFAAA